MMTRLRGVSPEPAEQARAMPQKPGEQGMTLVEVLVAAALLAVLAVSVGGLVVFVLRAQQSLAYRAEAMSIAETELELIHSAKTSSELERLLAERAAETPVDGHDGFTSQVTSQKPDWGQDPDYELVFVTVRWERGGDKGSVNLASGHYPWVPEDDANPGKGWRKHEKH